MRNQAQVLLKHSCTLGKFVNTQTKGITSLCIEKILLISVAFLMALSIFLIIFATINILINLIKHSEIDYKFDSLKPLVSRTKSGQEKQVQTK